MARSMLSSLADVFDLGREITAQRDGRPIVRATMLRVTVLAAGVLTTALSTSAWATPINLVTNGDFSAGNTGFTSEDDPVDENTLQGEFAVLTTPDGWNPWFIDAPHHTGAGGAMLVVNGATET